MIAVRWTRLLIHSCDVEGAHDFGGNSASTDSICQAKGEPGHPLLPLKQTNAICKDLDLIQKKNSKSVITSLNRSHSKQ